MSFRYAADQFKRSVSVNPEATVLAENNRFVRANRFRNSVGIAFFTRAASVNKKVCFAVVVFLTISIVFATITTVWFLLFAFNVIDVSPHERRVPVLMLLLSSLLLGGAVALYVGKVIIKPIKKIGDAFREVSEGNFSVRVSEDEKIDEIREMAKRFNAMTYDLSHIETLRTDFVANVLHEFKTPISSIEGYATLLQNPALSEEKRMLYTRKILENSRRLTNLTSNMLLLSKLENQATITDNKQFRLDEQIRKTILLLEDKWTKKNIVFDLDLPFLTYYGSEKLLKQVWFNVIDNAIKHSSDGGVIEISLKNEQSSIFVEIKDHGEGMSEEVMKHVFEKFYQGDSSRKEEGNGLGLALVKRIINICNGKISVKSVLGQGRLLR